MQSTTAIVAHEPKEPFQPNWSLDTVDLCSPKEHEVLVEIYASGICHTDLVLSGVPPGTLGVEYPKIMGHEGSGYVREVGAKVTKVQIGDPVLLSFDSCGTCTECSSQHPAYCSSFAQRNYVGSTGDIRTKGGEGISGRFFGQSSLARHSIVSEASVVNVKDLIRTPEELRFFAPLGCGFQTGVGAIWNTANATKDDKVMVLGVGAVGMAAIMAAKIRGCKTIVAVDRVEHRLKLAQELGATCTVNTATSRSNLSAELATAEVDGPSIVIDATGVPSLIEQGLAALCPRGKLVLVGVPPLTYELSLLVAQHINTGKSVVGCMEGDSVPEESISQLITCYRNGQFPVEKLIDFFPADDYNQALESLHNGNTIKPVLVWK